jgi:threonyl-tRNA synthetase
LLRAQEFRQDDAHLFVTEGQVQQELAAVLALAATLYGRFHLSFRHRLGTAPTDRLGDGATWERAVGTLRQTLDDVAGRGGYEMADGEGSFYAPKVDLLMTDSIGREWQTGTVQLDLVLPGRLGCHYISPSGAREVPVLIHRAIAGSFERFLALLLEQRNGLLPAPLCPVQVLICPVQLRHVPGAEVFASRLRAAGARVEVGDARRTVSALVRLASERRIPCVAVVGGRELESGRLAVRRGDGTSRLVGPEELAREVTTW